LDQHETDKNVGLLFLEGLGKVLLRRKGDVMSIQIILVSRIAVTFQVPILTKEPLCKNMMQGAGHG